METEIQPKKDKSKKITTAKALSFTFQFGLMIILPLLVFAFIGKWLAGKYDNQIYYYGSFVVAISVSTVWFYRKINDLYEDFIDKQ